MEPFTQVTFVPQLAIKSGTMELDFYKNGFGAVEFDRITNEDGSIHVSQMTIEGAMFHFHEDNPAKGLFSPDKCNGVTALIGLMVADVDQVITQAAAAGATVDAEAQDFDYGYRQGMLTDPLGHRWIIQKLLRAIP